MLNFNNVSNVALLDLKTRFGSRKTSGKTFHFSVNQLENQQVRHDLYSRIRSYGLVEDAKSFSAK